MSKSKKTPNFNENLLLSKVEAKLNAIRVYYEGSKPTFDVPAQFTFNWFSELSESGLERFSRGARLVQPGQLLRDKIEEELAAAESFRKKSKAEKKSDIDEVRELKAQVQKLKQRISELETWLQTRTDENHQLRRELQNELNLKGIQQAQMNQRNSVVTSLAKPISKPGASPFE